LVYVIVIGKIHFTLFYGIEVEGYCVFKKVGKKKSFWLFQYKPQPSASS